VSKASKAVVSPRKGAVPNLHRTSHIAHATEDLGQQ